MKTILLTIYMRKIQIYALYRVINNVNMLRKLPILAQKR